MLYKPYSTDPNATLNPRKYRVRVQLGPVVQSFGYRLRLKISVMVIIRVKVSVSVDVMVMVP